MAASNTRFTQNSLYQSSERLTLEGFPNRGRHDSRWQTEGVCHGPRYSGSDGSYRWRGSLITVWREDRGRYRDH
jgi:hypothetical protein